MTNSDKVILFHFGYISVLVIFLAVLLILLLRWQQIKVKQWLKEAPVIGAVLLFLGIFDNE